MSGPGYRSRSKRHRSRRSGFLKRAFLLSPFVFLALTGRVGVQDVSALIDQSEGNTPRWMATLQTAQYATNVPITYSAGSRSSDDPMSAPQVAITSAARGMQQTVVKGLGRLARDNMPSVIPDHIIIDRSHKGDRYISKASNITKMQQAAGQVYALPSLIGTSTPKALPQVAFVKPQPFSDRQSKMMADAASKPDGTPIDLQKIMMASNAAAASFSLVSAYAPETAHDTSEPFNALFGDKYEQGPPPPEDPENPHWWAMKPLPLSVQEPKEQRCLAEAIYYESRGEPEAGQVAVGQVVLNRVKNPAYPNTICEVVYQNRHKLNRCQFSFACDGIRHRVTSPEAWLKAKKVASDVTDGKQYSKMIAASTHYHAVYVTPRWASQMSKRGKIGDHIFYMTYGGGWN